MRVFKGKLIALMYLFLILGFGLSYPIKVLLVNADINVFIFFGIVSIFFYGMTLFGGDEIRKSYSLADFQFLTLIFLVVVGYVVAVVFHPNSASTLGNLRKFFMYWLLLVIALHAYRRVADIEKFGLLRVGMVVISISCFLASFSNSFLWRVPEEFLLSYDKKYVVGPFLRAGAGYVDCNFLASFFIVNMTLVYRFVGTKALGCVCLSILLAAVVLTFSRAGFILASISFLYFLFGGFRLGVKALVNIFSFVTLAFVLLFSFSDVLFERFTGDEGASSTNSRIVQYQNFANSITGESNVWGVLTGYGGQDEFMLRHREHLHNFIFSSILEIGWLFTAIYCFALFFFFVNYCRDTTARLAYFCAVAIMLVLPTTPESIFFMFATILMVNRATNGERNAR